MKKCNYCKNDADYNLVIQGATGKIKIPYCSEHKTAAYADGVEKKRGHIQEIPIHKKIDMRNNEILHDMVSTISRLAKRVDVACQDMLKNEIATIETVDNGGEKMPVEKRELDLKALLSGSKLEEEIPAMITICQYANELQFLLDDINSLE